MTKDVDERYSHAAEFAAAARTAAGHRFNSDRLCPATDVGPTVLAPRAKEIGTTTSVRPYLLATGSLAPARRANLVGRKAMVVSAIGITVAFILGVIAFALRSLSPIASLVLKIVCLSTDLVLQSIACTLGIAALSRPRKAQTAGIMAICFSLVATIVGALAAARLLLAMLAAD